MRPRIRTASLVVGLLLCTGAAFAQQRATKPGIKQDAPVQSADVAPQRLEGLLLPKGVSAKDVTIDVTREDDVLTVSASGQGIETLTWKVFLTNTHRLGGSNDRVAILASDGYVLSDRGDSLKTSLLMATNAKTGAVYGPIFIIPFVPIDPFAVPGIVDDPRCHKLCGDQYLDDTQILDELSEQIDSQRGFLDFLIFACNQGHQDACKQIPLEQDRLNEMVRRWHEIHSEHFERYAKCLLRCWFIMAK